MWCVQCWLEFLASGWSVLMLHRGIAQRWVQFLTEVMYWCEFLPAVMRLW